jgi:hypothetical protein
MSEPEMEMVPVPRSRRNRHIEYLPHEMAQQLQTLRQDAIEELKDKFADRVSLLSDDIKDSVLSDTRVESSELLRGLDMHTADIEAHCAQLKEQIQADRYDGELPIIEIPNGHVIPIAQFEIDTLHRNGLGEAFRIQVAPIEDAVAGFFTELKSFVLHRLAGNFFFPRIDALVGGLNGSGTTLPVTVYSNTTSGARVEYSPAYFIAFTALAAPTSPARGVVAPGRYIFKLAKGGNHMYDGGVFDIPHSFAIHLDV